jgi:hypothetical protein
MIPQISSDYIPDHIDHQIKRCSMQLLESFNALTKGMENHWKFSVFSLAISMSISTTLENENEDDFKEMLEAMIENIKINSLNFSTALREED